MYIEGLLAINRRIGLRTQLVFAFIILISLPLFIFGFHYYDVSRNLVFDIAEKNMYDVVRKNNQIIDTKLSQAKDNMVSFLIDKDLHNGLSSVIPNNDYQISLLDKILSVAMDKYFLNLKDIYSAQIATSYATFRTSIHPSGEYSSKNFIPEGAIIQTSMYREALAQEGKLVWIPTYNFSEMYNASYMQDVSVDYRYMFSAVEMIKGTYIDETTYEDFPPESEKPVLIVNYKEDFFRQVFQNSLPVKGSYFFVVTKDGQYISHQNQEKIGKNDHYEWIQSIIDKGSGTARVAIDGQDSIICFDTSEITGWVSLVVIPSHQLNRDILRTIKLYSVYSILLLILFFVFISYFVSGRITKPLKNLLKAFKQTGEGNFEISINETGSRELTVLSERFKDMNEKIQRLIEENYESKIKEKEAEIKALNLQLDPHFMYNTLNVINLISVENGQDEISEMIISLSNMLKYTVRTTTEQVPFKNDWEYLQSYILIMSKRFEGRFLVETEIDPEINTYKAPKFFLQPFVENAFVHGFEKRKAGGVLLIKGCVHNGCLQFEVEDNGQGMSDEQLARIQKCDETSVGIQNVNKRIKIMYGESYGVTFESVLGQGTKVLIRIPGK
ncbi:histidine kinase [Paenibacillus oryzisoli]|uniref:sensor histidine kinase n=1 Tax=Paenibacillus oryzisoli TaxID=1850517 RepID=UPI003D27F2E8